MKTKTVVAVLAVLGILAALSTAVLAASFRVKPVRELVHIAPPETKLLIASRDVSAMSVLELDAITEKTVLNKDAPEDYYSDTTQVAGRVLVVDMVKGQPYKKSSFAKEGSGAQLAGMLSPTMRAMTVSLNGAPGLGSLIYPGSIVDILVSFSVSLKSGKGEAVSTTLLEGITVLAVDNLTVSDPSGMEANMASSSRSRKKMLITLLVDTRQAEALQLASIYGRMALTMRNPQDLEAIDNTATLLSGGAIARLANTLGVSVSGGQTPRPADDGAIGEVVIDTPPPTKMPVQAIGVYRGSLPVVSVQLSGLTE